MDQILFIFYTSGNYIAAFGDYAWFGILFPSMTETLSLCLHTCQN